MALAPFRFAARAVRGAVAIVRSKARERRKDKERSPKWPHVRDVYLRQHPTCAGCGRHRALQVHHKRPYHLHPELELDQSNLIGLCMTLMRQCHLDIGHGGDFGHWNPNVDADASEALSGRTGRAVVERRACASRLKDDAPAPPRA